MVFSWLLCRFLAAAPSVNHAFKTCTDSSSQTWGAIPQSQHKALSALDSRQALHLVPSMTSCSLISAALLVSSSPFDAHATFRCLQSDVSRQFHFAMSTNLSKAIHRRHRIFSCEQAYELLGCHGTNLAASRLRQPLYKLLVGSLIPAKHCNAELKSHQ